MDVGRVMRAFDVKSKVAAATHVGAKAAQSVAAKSEELARSKDGSKSPETNEFRKRLGQFVGNIFYGQLFQQMSKSPFKTKYLSGGRGEEVFRNQLYMQLGQRMGESPNNQTTNHLYEAIRKRSGYQQALPDLPQKQKSEKLESVV